MGREDPELPRVYGAGEDDGQLLPALPTPVDQHPARVYLARLAPGSRRTMLEALNTMASLLTDGQADAHTLPWAALRYQHVQALRAAVAERYAPATANKFLSALRGCLKEAWRLGQMTAEDFQHAADVDRVRGSELPRGRALSLQEVKALAEVCQRDTSAAGARDAAILAVLRTGGLRRAELVALDLVNYTPSSRGLAVRHGKGRKSRQVYITHRAAHALTAWLRWRGEEPGPLFRPISHQHILSKRLSAQAVLDILHRRAEQAQVAPFSPHDLRRTFISDLLDAGADISTVQQLAGHSQVTTTQRYDRRGEATKRRAVDLLDQGDVDHS